MNFILLCGPPASGKMTVGQALQQQLGYKLFHNHMSLELANQFFDWSTPEFNALDKHIRFGIFEIVAASSLKGMVFTLVWAFDLKEDEAYVDEIMAIFKKHKAKVHIVELVCNLEERLKRNKTENRLQHKPSKRDVAASEKRLLANNNKYRMNSHDGEFPNKHILKINNTYLSAAETAEEIIRRLGLR